MKSSASDSDEEDSPGRVTKLVEQAKAQKQKEKASASIYQGFLEKTLGVLVATVLSDANFFWFVCVAGEISGFNERGEISLAADITCRAVNATLMCLLIPVLQYALSHGATDGESLVRDSLKLWLKISGTGIAWATKDVVAAAMKHHHWGDGRDIIIMLSIAAGLSLTAVAVECSPCFIRHVARRQAGEDSICLRLILVPLQSRLALGFAWHTVFQFAVELVSTEFAVVFLVQLVYTILTAVFIRWSTAMNAIYNLHAKDMSSKKAPETSSNTPSCTLTLFNLFQATMVFVFGWAINDTLNMLIFGVYSGCLSEHWSPATCSYQLNFAYASIVIWMFAVLSSQIEAGQNAAIIRFSLKRGRTLEVAQLAAKKTKEMVITAMTLIAGWAWTNSLNSIIAARTKAVKADKDIISTGIVALDKAILFTLVSIPTLLFAAWVYHFHLESHRNPHLLAKHETHSHGYAKPASVMPMAVTPILPLGASFRDEADQKSLNDEARR